MPVSAIVTLVPGSTISLVATAFSGSGLSVGKRTVTWSSSDLNVATVDSQGLVTAVSAGTATITATDSYDSLTATATVNVVSNSAASLKITSSGGTMADVPQNIISGTQTLIATPPSIWDTEVPAFDDAITGNTQTTVISFPITKDGIFSAIVDATAATSDGADWATWLLMQVVLTRISGTLSVQTPAGPQAPTLQGGATSATWTLEFAANGNNFLVKVQGAVAVTINWSVHVAGNRNV